MAGTTDRLDGMLAGGRRKWGRRQGATRCGARTPGRRVALGGRTGRLALASLLAIGAATASERSVSAAPWTTTDLSQGVTATQLAQSLVGAGVAVSNVTYTGDPQSAGTFADPSGAVGITSGVVLSSGLVSDVVGPNEEGGSGAGLGTPGDADLDAIVAPETTNDAAVLSFSFVPNSPQINISYVFASEEYQEFVGSDYNDVFAFYVNGQNCATVPGTSDNVTINSINPPIEFEPASGRNSTFYVDNPQGATEPLDTEFDGMTIVLTCRAAVTPGAPSTLKLAIADTADSIYDSAVFLQAGGITSAPVGAFSPVQPARVVDTRQGIGKVQPGSPIEVQVTGQFGVPADALAVVLNVTATEPEGDGFLTVYPADVSQPSSSNVNYVAGGTSPNAVVVKTSAGGKIKIASRVPSHVIVDVFGWYGPGGSSRLLPIRPERLVDTRKTTGQVSPSSPLSVQVAGVAGVPAQATAAVLNVTAVDAVAQGFLTVYPSGTDRPGTSSVNYSGPRAVPNTVIAPLGADGKINVYTLVPANVIVDVMGWVGPGGVQEYNEIAPDRIYDSREAVWNPSGVKPNPGQVIELQVTGRGGVPAIARAVFLNITVTQPEADGFVTVWPASGAQPASSNLNFAAGQTVPNGVVVGLSPGGKVRIFVLAPTHVIVDVTGWFA